MLRRERPESLLRPDPSGSIDRSDLVARYRRNRERSRALFGLLIDEDAHYSRPIPLRHPVVFYEGHVPAFSFNTLVKNALGEAGIDPKLEALFARGIDPPTARSPVDDTARNREEWPSSEVVERFAREVDARVIEALTDADIDRPGHPLLDRAEAVFVILEHEAMHQETLHYMLHRLPCSAKRPPSGYRPRVEGAARRRAWVEIAPGRATLGVDRGSSRFAWDNERPHHAEQMGAFAIERDNVTNAAFMEFVDAGGDPGTPPLSPPERSWRQRGRLPPPFFLGEGAGRRVLPGPV